MKVLKVNHFRLWRNIKSYGLVFLFLGFVIFITWYLFFYLNVFNDTEKRITGILSTLGFGFALFQFWFNHITTIKSRSFDLRYNAYKEIISAIDSISETLNEQMTSKPILDVHKLVSDLMNQINRLASAMSEHNVYLFPDIVKTPESKKMDEITQKILQRTDVFRMGIEEASKQFDNSGKDFLRAVETMNWHNEMRVYIGELHNYKYPFYKKLREYL